jgi:23S rRNA (guanosine2251-2'-O)-methyltransferase
MADKPKKPNNKFNKSSGGKASGGKSGGGFKKSFGKSEGGRKSDGGKSDGSKKPFSNSGSGRRDGGGKSGDSRNNDRDDNKRSFSNKGSSRGPNRGSDRNSDRGPSEPRRYDGLKKFENRSRGQSDSRSENKRSENRPYDNEGFEGPKIFNEKTYRNSSRNDDSFEVREPKNSDYNKKPAKKYEQFDDNKFASKKSYEKKPYEKNSWRKDNDSDNRQDGTNNSDRNKEDRNFDKKPWEKKKFGDKKPWDKKQYDKKPWESKPKSGGGESKILGNDGRYYIYGKHPVLLAIANPKRVIKKILCSLNSYNFLIEKLGEEQAAKIPHEIFDVKQLDKMLPADSNHQGIILESEPLEQKTVDEVLESKVLVLLDQITDPHNVGAIIRSSAAFGVGAVITTERSSSPESATIIKTSAGTFETMPYIRGGNLNDIINQLKEANFHVIGLDGDAEIDIKVAASGAEKLALVIGAEGKGLRHLVKQNCDVVAKINIANSVESLNASVAAAIALFALSS